MGYESFDIYATEYDSWFMENSNVLETEVRLVASCLENAGDVLSIGCGSGLFEKILNDKYGIIVKKGIEPSAAMAEIAQKRGMEVTVGTGEAHMASPCYSHETVEDPCEGYDRGSYVVISAFKPV